MRAKRKAVSQDVVSAKSGRHQRRIVGPITDLEACTDRPPVDVRPTIHPGANHDAWSRTYDLSAGHDINAWLLELRVLDAETEQLDLIYRLPR